MHFLCTAKIGIHTVWKNSQHNTVLPDSGESDAPKGGIGYEETTALNFHHHQERSGICAVDTTASTKSTVLLRLAISTSPLTQRSSITDRLPLPATHELRIILQGLHTIPSSIEEQSLQSQLALQKAIGEQQYNF